MCKIMVSYSLGVPNGIDRLVAKYCKLTGRSKNSVCVQWILEKAVEELGKLETVASIMEGDTPELSSSSEESPEE
jgi:hypothetical protein